MKEPQPNDEAITPEPSGATVTAVRRQVQREGGRGHDFLHTDREVIMDLPGKISGKMKPTAVPLCTCGKQRLVSIPQGPPIPGLVLDPVRVCIECDGLPSWPRYNDVADEQTGD